MQVGSPGFPDVLVGDEITNAVSSQINILTLKESSTSDYAPHNGTITNPPILMIGMEISSQQVLLVYMPKFLLKQFLLYHSLPSCQINKEPLVSGGTEVQTSKVCSTNASCRRSPNSRRAGEEMQFKMNLMQTLLFLQRVIRIWNFLRHACSFLMAVIAVISQRDIIIFLRHV